MQPASWAVLLEALEDSGFYTQAETVKSNLSLIYNTSGILHTQTIVYK